MTGILGGAATVGAGLAATSIGSDADTDGGPPSIRIQSIEWVGVTSRYAIRGTVEDIGDNVLWSFNQLTNGDEFGPAYIERGPCKVLPSNDFVCNANYAGTEGADAGKQFTMWVAAQSTQQAADIAVLEANGVHSFPTPNGIPHTPGKTSDTGESTLVGATAVHP